MPEGGFVHEITTTSTEVRDYRNGRIDREMSGVEKFFLAALATADISFSLVLGQMVEAALIGWGVEKDLAMATKIGIDVSVPLISAGLAMWVSSVEERNRRRRYETNQG